MDQRYFLFFFSFLLSLPIGSQGQYRSLDGTDNNLDNPNWGAAHGDVHRAMSEGYADGISEPGMMDFTNPREISNYMYSQTSSMPSALNISDYGWAFGQFIDHDITLIKDNPDEMINIPIPMGDPMFDPMNTGTQEIIMRRSKYDLDTGTDVNNPRVQMNDISAWIDASNIYGTEEVAADWLRSFSEGKLKTSAGNMLPFNTTSGEYDDLVDPDAPEMAMEGTPQEKYFVSGDIRCNEQPILTAFHTLFMREHNRYCDELVLAHPGWSDEELYQTARKFVGAHIQAVTYNEWLPSFGIELVDYPGYDDEGYPNITNVFSAAAFRLGHSMINGNLIRIDGQGNTIADGDMSLQEAFFNPMVLLNEGGVEPLFQGMATQAQQEFDTKVVDDLRNFLFGPPGAGGLDLVAININRGRERGLPDYNSTRSDLGLSPVSTFQEISSDPDIQFELMMMYGQVDAIDPWVGMLAEDHMEGTAMGETVLTILTEQFSLLRDADRFFYFNDPAFTLDELVMIDNTLLSEIILRNTGIEHIQEDVFHATPFDQLLSASTVDAPMFSLYPNPATDRLGIRSSVSIQGYEIIDSSGRLVQADQGRQEHGIDISSLESGIYVLHLRSDEGQSSQVFVKE